MIMRKEKLEPLQCVALDKNGKPKRIRWPRGVFRFYRGATVWVRDHAHKGHGYTIVQARVVERHYHPDRHPGYPHGEGYRLQGELWWDCYPGCRVFATRAQAIAARISRKAGSGPGPLR